MIEKRPLSSVVAVKLLGDAPGFSAVTVAPLIGLPASSLTTPPTRPVWAAALAAKADDEQRGQHARWTDEDADACSKPPVKVQYILNSVKHSLAALRSSRPSSRRSGLGAQTPAPAVESSAGFAPIAPLVEAAIARHELPGAVVLVGRGDADRSITRRSASARCGPSPEPMTEDTIFDLASLTKVVATTTSVMKLVEEGRIRLNDPVAQFIPEFGRYGKSGITIRHLLTHTSGLRPDLELEVEFHGADEAIRRAIEEVPTSPPGERFVYSDINFFLLGDIVRRVSGERLDRYAKAQHLRSARHERDDVPAAGVVARRESRRPRRAPPLAWPCPARRLGRAVSARHRPRSDRAAHGRRRRARRAVQHRRRSVALLPDAARRRPPRRRAHPVAGDGRAHDARRRRRPEMRDVRGLGWDIDSSYSSNRGELFPIGSFGHTGFTGTSLWLDPGVEELRHLPVEPRAPRRQGRRDARCAARSRRLPPRRCCRRTTSRDASADARARAFTPSDAGARLALGESRRARMSRCSTGIDVLAAENFARLRGKRVGLLTNQTGRSRDGVEHDRSARARRRASRSPRCSAPSTAFAARSTIASIRRATRRPACRFTRSTARRCARPPRCSTASTSSSSICRTSARGSTPIRPRSPTCSRKRRSASCRSSCSIGRIRSTASTSRAPAQDAGGNRYVGYLPMPVRHGLTIGELARLFNGEGADRRRPHRGADEELAARRLVRRDRRGLGRTRRRTCATWWRPRSIRASARSRGPTSRSGAAPTRRSSSSARRGSTVRRWRRRSTRARCPASASIPVTFTPAAGAKLGGQACHGVFLIVTDRDRLRPVRVGLRDRVGVVEAVRSAVQAGRRRRAVRAEGDAREDSRRRRSRRDRRVVGRRRSEVAPDAREVPAVLKRVVFSDHGCLTSLRIAPDVGAGFRLHRADRGQLRSLHPAVVLAERPFADADPEIDEASRAEPARPPATQIRIETTPHDAIASVAA